MSKDNEFSEYWKYLKLNHPGAFTIINLLHNNFTELYEEIFHVSAMDDKTKRISFEVKKDNFGKPQLQITKESMVFLTALSETILQIIAGLIRADADYKKLETQLKEEIENNPTIVEETVNMCPKCSVDNNINAVYCSKCGNKLL
jgi:hypothetical protein